MQLRMRLASASIYLYDPIYIYTYYYDDMIYYMHVELDGAMCRTRMHS